MDLGNLIWNRRDAAVAMHLAQGHVRQQSKVMAMNLHSFVGQWVMLIHSSPPPPWQESMPLGTGFEIFKNTHGLYWLPNPSLTTPMNQTRKLEIDTQGRGNFLFGKPLDGSLYADFGDTIGMISFTLNAIGPHRRIISLSHRPAGGATVLPHGGSHGVDI